MIYSGELKKKNKGVRPLQTEPCFLVLVLFTQIFTDNLFFKLVDKCS